MEGEYNKSYRGISSLFGISNNYFGLDITNLHA
jgi:hypothetical protein